VAAKILDGVEGGTGQYLDHSSIRSILNLTRSPGSMSEGCSDCGSNIATGAHPMAFHPFGLVSTATPVCIPPMVTEPARMLSDGTDLRGMWMHGSRPWR